MIPLWKKKKSGKSRTALLTFEEGEAAKDIKTRGMTGTSSLENNKETVFYL